jgi:hypothetical protein
MDIPTRR